MATLLMKLRDVPAEELEEVRALLSEHELDCYETEPGRWGISVGAIWLRDDTQAERARALLAEYAEQRQASVRAEYEARRRAGEADTLLRRLLRHPLQMLACLLAIALILALSLKPFIDLARPGSGT